MERSFEFNNAGVECIEAGHHKVAWDLFKGALEIKLASERIGIMGSKDFGSPEHASDTGRCNSYIERAEGHLMNIDSYVPKEVCITRTSPASGISSAFTNNRGQGADSEGDCSSDSLYAPFIFRHPMRLQTNSDMTTRRESATIIFNLALVDHLKNRCSEQAVQLYELAMTLLTGDPVDRLGLALMNNIGVWCYENGDQDGSLACMNHISNFMGTCSSFVDKEQIDGLQSNILWLMNPPFAASPAA